jgi:hypothetical protein
MSFKNKRKIFTEEGNKTTSLSKTTSLLVMAARGWFLWVR